MKHSIIHLMFLLLGSYLLGNEAIVVSPLLSRASSPVDFTKQETAPNKVPVINIAQPNNAGVSHNCYDKFNVNSEGLILNNSTVAAKSQLGGMLMGNANLDRTGSASLIVNEVVGPTQSQINGFVEVHGKAADLVVANPNGISVNGGGFINAPKVTLTTGVPEFDANGALQSLLVQQGKVSIGEQGMHVQDCNYCDILANAVEINGAIQGQKSEHEGTDMHVVSGYYRFDYPSRTATEEGTGVPILGVDSAALGGMYAGKIYFQAKGRNVGVKLPPNMVTNTGDLVVEADGSIHITGHVNSTWKIEVTTSDNIFSESSKLGARDKINMSASSISMQGIDVFTHKTLSLNATDAFRSSESYLNSEKTLHIQAGSMESVKDQFTSSDSIVLKSTGGALDLKKSKLDSLEEIRLQSAANLWIKGNVKADQRIALKNVGDLHNEGILESSEGEIYAQTNGNSLIKGKWVARNGISITSDQAVTIENHSLLDSKGPISVNDLNGIKISGSVLSSGDVVFESDKSMDFKSTDSRIDGQTTLKARNLLSLSELLVGLSSILFSAEDVKIQPETQIESHTDVTIDAQKTLAIQPNSAVAVKGLSIKSPTITNEGLLQGSDSVALNADRQLTNAGQILSNEQVAITTPELQNNGRIQSASGNFNVANLSNAGGMWIAGPWTLVGDKTVNTGWIRIDGPWTGRFNAFENQAGRVKGATVDFTDSMRWLNKARMDFSGDVLLPQSTFENTSANFYSGGDVVLDTLRNVNEKEPKVGPLKIVPELCKWQLFDAIPARKLANLWANNPAEMY